MSGPIVRSGPSKKFAENWDNVFGNKKSKAKKTSKTTKKKTTKKKKKG